MIPRSARASHARCREGEQFPGDGRHAPRRARHAQRTAAERRLARDRRRAEQQLDHLRRVGDLQALSPARESERARMSRSRAISPRTPASATRPSSTRCSCSITMASAPWPACCRGSWPARWTAGRTRSSRARAFTHGDGDVRHDPFEAEAEQLGAITAELHRALASPTERSRLCAAGCDCRGHRAVGRRRAALGRAGIRAARATRAEPRRALAPARARRVRATHGRLRASSTTSSTRSAVHPRRESSRAITATTIWARCSAPRTTG